MKSTIRSLAGTIILSLLAVAACKGKAPPAEVKAGEADVNDDAQVAKVNVYVGCLNSMNKYITKARDDYYKWADPETGPTLEGAGNGVGPISRETTYGYDCFKRDGGLDKVETMTPKMEELDKAGAEYKKSMLALMDTVGKANTYYEHKDYKDDNLAKGKEMHKGIVDAFTAFDKSTDDLEAALEKISDKMNVDELASLEKTEGKKARWHQRKIMIDAEAFLRVLDSTQDPDETKLKAPFDTYAKTWADAKEWTDKNQAEADKNVSWNTFIKEADSLQTAQKELFRAFRDKKEDTSKEQDKILDEYNDLVHMSNGLWD